MISVTKPLWFQLCLSLLLPLPVVTSETSLLTVTPGVFYYLFFSSSASSPSSHFLTLIILRAISPSLSLIWSYLMDLRFRSVSVTCLRVQTKGSYCCGSGLPCKQFQRHRSRGPWSFWVPSLSGCGAGPGWVLFRWVLKVPLTEKVTQKPFLFGVFCHLIPLT